MPTRRTTTEPVTDVPDSGLTAAAAVQLMRTTSTETDPGALPNDDDDDERSLIDEMSALLSESPQERVRVRLYRVPAIGSGKRHYDFCEEISADEFRTMDLSTIRAKWGPGVYQLRLIGSQGLVRAQQVSIAPMSSALPAPSSQPQESELSQVLRALIEGQQKLAEALTQRPDPRASMRETVELMAMMRDAMGIGSNPAPAVDPMAQLASVLSMARELKAATKELADDSPPAPEPTDPLAMLPKVLDLVGTALKQNQPAPVAPLLPMQIPASVNAAAVEASNASTGAETQTLNNPVSSPQTNAPTDSAEAIMIQGHIATLCRLCDAGVPPDKGGEYIAANLPDELLDQMEHPQWFELVSSVFADLKPREAWMRAAKAHADKLLSEESASDEETGPAA